MIFSQAARLALLAALATALALPAQAAPPDAPATAPVDEDASLLGSALFEAAGRFRQVAFTAQGRQIITLSEDGIVRLWDAVSGRVLQRLPAEGVQSFAGPNGPVLALSMRKGALRLWNLEEGAPAGELEGKGAVHAIALPTDGKAVIVGTDADIVVRPLEGEEDARTLTGPAGPVHLVAADRDGRIAAAGVDQTVWIFPAAADAQPVLLDGHRGDILALAFSPDGRTVASAAEDGTIRLWDAARGTELNRLEGHLRPAVSLAFSADGRLLASAGRDGTVRLWATPRGKELRRMDTRVPPSALAFSPDGRLIVTASGSEAELWDVAVGTRRTALAGPVAAGAVALHPAGRQLAVGSDDGIIRLVDRASGHEVLRLEPHAGPVTALAFSADGELLASTSSDRTARVVDAATGEVRLRFPGHGEAVRTLAFSPEGLLATGAEDRTVRLWDLENGRLVWRQRLAEGPVTALAFTPDGTNLFAATDDGTLRTFDVASRRELRQMSGHTGPIHALALSADGRSLASAGADRTTRIWDVATGNERLIVRGHRRAITSVGFGPEPTVLATGSLDGTVRVWDLAGRGAPRQRLSLDGHGGGVRALAFAATGELVGAVASDGALHLWNLPQGERALVARHGPADTWLAATSTVLHRVDDGRLLMRVADDGRTLASVLPTAPQTAPRLTAKVVETAPASDGFEPGTIAVQVSNAQDAGPAHWVAVSAPRSPLGILPPRAAPRLGPGESTVFRLGVTASGASPVAPQQVRVPLQVTHAHGEPTTLEASLRVLAPSVRVTGAVRSGRGDQAVAQLTIANVGDAPTGPLSISADFLRGTSVKASAPVQSLADLAPGAQSTLALSIPPGAAGDGELSLAVRVDGSRGLGHVWAETAVVQTALPMELAIAGGALAALLVIFLLWSFLRGGRHPVVQALVRNPDELLGYELRQLPMVNKALTRARKLDAVLAAARIPVGRWRRAVTAAGSPEKAAQAFAETMGATVEAPVDGGGAWVVEMPQLALRFSRRTAVAVLTGKDAEMGELVRLASAIYADGSGPTSAVALDLTDSGRAAELARTVRRVSFIVLSANELRDLLFSENPVEGFQAILAGQRPAAEISPYQTAGGVEDEDLFFGRERELRTIADRTLHNFILVGPRQAGKSSLMKAVRRRLAARADVEVHSFTVFKDDLAGSVARQLGRPRPETAGEFMKMAAGKPKKPRVFLVDEADGFIVQDAKTGYPLSQAMRALAEDGRAYFIMAGFWHLYAAAVLTPNNPLRNFGEVVRLAPLDRNAARALATQPMVALQIEYESPAVVERLLEETGCRPHLVVLTCKGLLEALGPNERTITQRHLDFALYRNADLADELKSWRRDPLGRAVLRAALMGEPPTRGELRERLAKVDCRPSTELFTAAVDRLELAFQLTTNEDGRLVCPVPLLRWFVEREADLEKGLRQDVADYRAVG